MRLLLCFFLLRVHLPSWTHSRSRRSSLPGRWRGKSHHSAEIFIANTIIIIKLPNFPSGVLKVTIKLLPMNCLWSPWSDWSKCSAECGEGEMVRERSVVLPAKNGGDFLTMDVSRAIQHFAAGKCEGEQREGVWCASQPCDSPSA